MSQQRLVTRKKGNPDRAFSSQDQPRKFADLTAILYLILAKSYGICFSWLFQAPGNMEDWKEGRLIGLN